MTLTQQSISDDASAADAITRTVDWGDGTAPQQLDPSAKVVSKAYTKLGSHPVAVTLTDASGKENQTLIRPARCPLAGPVPSDALHPLNAW